MRLIRNDIATIADKVVSVFCHHHGVAPSDLYNVADNQRRFSGQALRDYSHALDFGAAGWIANQAQTFIFDGAQALAFLRAVDRRLPPGDYPAPFPHMCIQFDRGIDEKLFTTGLRSSGSAEESDTILGLLLAFPDGDNPEWNFINVIAWYKSASINRIQVSVRGDGAIEYRQLDDTIADRAETLRHDKQRIANLALLCLAYMNSPRMTVRQVGADQAVNRKRAAKGKRLLEDYYVVEYEPGNGSEQAGGTPGAGRHVSFRFDVAGHFRRLADGRTIWIRAHQRGVEHELYRPKVYRVR